MSDQDFFFDEEDETPPKPAAKATKPAVKAVAKPAAKPGANAAAKAAVSQGAPAASSSVFDQTITLAVASLMTVGELLIGVIVGVVVARADTSPVASTGIASPASPTGATAPSLTQDQLNSGKLPAGHPAVGAASAASGTAPATGTKK